MADSVQNKNLDRAYIRELQQDKNTKKKDLAEQQREDLKQMKTYYAEKNKEIDDDTAAAINHIKTEQTENDRADREYELEERRNRLEEKRDESHAAAESRPSPAVSQSNVSQSSVYNRKGTIKTLS